MIATVRDAPIRLRARPELQFESTYYDGERRIVAKSPVSLKYTMLGETEFTLLGLLDGKTSLGALAKKASERLKPKRVKLNDVQRLLTMLHRSGLVVSDAPNQGVELLGQKHETRRKEILSTFSNPLAIRFPGIDPERFLSWTYPFTRWLFHPAILLTSLMLIIAAVFLVCANVSEFYRRLPSYQQFFAFENAVWLMAILGVTKVIHEFGHAYTCKHFGGECHKIGFMLLVFTPALYCDTSDSWRMPERWKRISIAAAGMYVEFVMASFATFIWWWTNSGFIHYLCLGVMLTCSVSTLFFNGNPLLRYDGYYILCDLLRIPNLAQRSRNLLHRTLREICLGIRDKSGPVLPVANRWPFVLYAIASNIYRWFILGVILWAVYRILRPYELQSLSTLLLGVSVASLTIPPVWKTTKYLRIPGQMNRVNKYRFGLSAIVLVLTALLILYLPLPHRVVVPLLVQPANATRVYAETSGRFDSLLTEPGQRVQSGDLLAKLENTDLRLAAAKIETEYQTLKNHLANLKTRSVTDPEVADLAATNEVALRDLRSRRQQLREDIARLELRAPDSGIVFPPLDLNASVDAHMRRELMLDRRFLGNYVEEGTAFCWIAEPGATEGLLVIDEARRDNVEVGQAVSFVIDAQTWIQGKGKILAIAEANIKSLPSDLTNATGGPLETDRDGNAPTVPSFVARCSIETKLAANLVGMRGSCKVYVKNESLYRRAKRFVSKHLRFR